MTHSLALVSEEKHSECSTHGAFTSTNMGINKLGMTRWSDCPACEAKRETEREERALAADIEEAAQTLARRLKAGEIPPRFAGKTLENYDPKTASQRRILGIAKEYVANFDNHLAAGRCMILAGKVGTGKTHIACGILQAIASRPFAGGAWRRWSDSSWKEPAEHPVRYATVSGIIRAIRETWNNHEVSEADALRKFTKPHLLALDEVGRQFGSDAEKTQLEELLDMRYQEMKPTIVCTNIGDKAQIATFLGERGLDRLRENGGIMSVFDWASHRGRT
jgi:DNA replication protein DnaC